MALVEDAHLVVDQLELRDLRVGAADGLAQRLVERVDRTVALPGDDQPIVLEEGGEGSRNAVPGAPGGGPGASALLRNGASGLLKVAPPLVERVRPFLGVGLGASYVSVQGEADGRYSSDLMEEVPLAAGIEFTQGSFTAGLRATYRALIDQGFAAETPGAAARAAIEPSRGGGGLLDASLTLGGRF